MRESGWSAGARTLHLRRAHLLLLLRQVVAAGAPLRRGWATAVLRHHPRRARVRRRLPPHAGRAGRRAARVAARRLAVGGREAVSLRSAALSAAHGLSPRAVALTDEIDGALTMAGSSCCALDCGACACRRVAVRVALSSRKRHDATEGSSARTTQRGVARHGRAGTAWRAAAGPPHTPRTWSMTCRSLMSLPRKMM
jgi:hypothetical protein